MCINQFSFRIYLQGKLNNLTNIHNLSYPYNIRAYIVLKKFIFVISLSVSYNMSIT